MVSKDTVDFMRILLSPELPSFENSSKVQIMENCMTSGTYINLLRLETALGFVCYHRIHKPPSLSCGGFALWNASLIYMRKWDFPPLGSSGFAEARFCSQWLTPLSTIVTQFFPCRCSLRVQSSFIEHAVCSCCGLHSFQHFWLKHIACTRSSSSFVKYKFKVFFCDKNQRGCIPFKYIQLKNTTQPRNFFLNIVHTFALDIFTVALKQFSLVFTFLGCL